MGEDAAGGGVLVRRAVEAPPTRRLLTDEAGFRGAGFAADANGNFASGGN